MASFQCLSSLLVDLEPKMTLPNSRVLPCFLSFNRVTTTCTSLIVFKSATHETASLNMGEELPGFFFVLSLATSLSLMVMVILANGSEKNNNNCIMNRGWEGVNAGL